jgi:ABC-type lipoprotein export system ATPase subunit
METPLIELRDLAKVYRTGHEAYTALDGANLSVRRGEFVALMGPSGSGKTTLLYLVAGVLEPTAGQVMIDGVSISELSDAGRARVRNARLGFVFQRFNLLGFLPAAKNVEVQRLVGGKRGNGSRSAKELLAEVGLGKKDFRRVNALSAGEQQRVAIARALANNPDLLLADEPTGNLDSRTAQAILNLLLALRRQFRLTILMATHNSAVAELADRIVEIQDGRVLRQWSPAAIEESRGAGSP